MEINFSQSAIELMLPLGCVYVTGLYMRVISQLGALLMNGHGDHILQMFS